MKRIISIFLISVLLAGCSGSLKEPVTFYYVRTGYEADMSEIIGTEQREASGHREDLAYLLALYFMGPANEKLESPFPAGITLYRVHKSGTHVTLTLSDTAKTLSDAQLSLACGCLSLTCMEITDAETVTVYSGERTVTMSADTLLLSDSYTANTTEDPK